jgi:curved DNA-binding protein
LGKDYYQILGVAKDAAPDEIKKAYHKLALQYHPDRNPGNAQAEERFKQVSEAYAVLADPEKRRQFDRIGARDFGAHFSTEDILRDFNLDDILGQFGMRPSGWGWRTTRSGSGGGSSFFDFFGSGPEPRRPPPPRRPARGPDAEVPLSISFHESMHGSERSLTVEIDGETRELSVQVPAGVASGKRLRLKGKGHRGPEGPGDLYLLVKVEEDPRFQRTGDDIHASVGVLPSVLLLGGHVDVPTTERPRQLRIPAGTVGGRIIRIRGQGAPRLGKKGERGDLYVRIDVIIPEHLSEAQAAAARALRDAGL